MLETRIVCDGCGEPIEGRPGYPKNEYISVSIQNIPMPPVDSVFLVNMHSVLDRSYQFHNLKCLANWQEIKNRS